MKNVKAECLKEFDKKFGEDIVVTEKGFGPRGIRGFVSQWLNKVERESVMGFAKYAWGKEDMSEYTEGYLTKTKEQEAPKLQNMVENPATYPSNTLLSRIFPKRLSNSLHNKVTVDRNRSQEWLCIETVDDLTNLINKYGFEKIEDTKNIGSIGVAEIAQLYGLTVHEMRSKNPRMLLVKPLQINNLTKTKEQEGEK